MQAGGAGQSGCAAADSDMYSDLDTEDEIARMTPEVCLELCMLEPSSPSLRTLRQRRTLLLRTAHNLVHQCSLGQLRSVITAFAGLAWSAPAI